MIGGGRPGISTLPAYRPDWGWGGNRPGWNNGWNNGWNHGWHNGWPGGWNNSWHTHWHNHWHVNHIHHGYHGWYHGCWTNVNWYAPLAFGVTGWGFASLNGWGLGVPYYNPYFVPTVSSGYDYSQPIVVNNYVLPDDADESGNRAAPPPAINDPTVQLVEEARVLIYEQKYRQALGTLETALKRSPGDPVIHELRALCQFALGEYDKAAAALNALLASAPGMDWTTMSVLYADADDYTRQLRRLESHCKSKPDDSAAAFVLAYHYLVLSETDAAVNALRAVVKRQPRDAVARRMLDSLAPPAADESPERPRPSPPTPEGEDGLPEIDLEGTWTARGGETPITLTIEGDFGFVWTAKPPERAPIEIKGQVETSADTLVLDAGEQGTMAGEVRPRGGDEFEFRLLGTPDDESGLVFKRRR